MSYSVNPITFKSIFAVPTDIVDKHIRLANGHQLKVLLWILRNSPENPDIEKMCTALKITKSDALDYLQYWVETEILSDDGNEITFSKTEPVTTVTEKDSSVEDKKAILVNTTPSKPSSAEIATRLSESPEIGHLFNEAQIKLGKTIGYDGQCTLLLIHDHYGLPTEVIFMMIDYCVSVGKTNYGYLDAVGKDWGTREIDTLDKAAEQITILRNANSLWKEFASAAGITTPRPSVKQTEYIRRWGNELKYGIDMIMLAYEEMANHTGKLSLSYMDKVLISWHNKGFKTPSDVEKSKEELVQTKTAKAGNSNNASYDLDEFKQRSLHSELKYERKKKQ